MSVSTEKQLYIGEGFEGPGVNLAHINVLVGPRNGPAGQAFATALSTPSAGHAPFVVIARPGIPTKPLTLYVNKAQIEGDFHGNATWGASQAGIAKAVAESLENGTLPPEAENDWVVVSAVQERDPRGHERPAASRRSVRRRAPSIEPVLYAETTLKRPPKRRGSRATRAAQPPPLQPCMELEQALKR
jgi:formaldehyde-activating enzyme